MPDEETLRILQRIEGKVDDVQHTVNDIQVAQRTQSAVNGDFRERLRALDGTINNLVATRTTGGEI
jgi:hypothetical protein